MKKSRTQRKHALFESGDEENSDVEDASHPLADDHKAPETALPPTLTQSPPSINKTDNDTTDTSTTTTNTTTTTTSTKSKSRTRSKANSHDKYSKQRDYGKQDIRHSAVAMGYDTSLLDQQNLPETYFMDVSVDGDRDHNRYRDRDQNESRLNNNNNIASNLNKSTLLQTFDDNFEVYSSGGSDIETFETHVNDDHSLLPLKQGWLKKKSENIQILNKRWVVLYPSFILYYNDQPKMHSNKKKESSKDINEINHPTGAIYLANYHLCIRKDGKRPDFTFVPHDSAIQMGLANKSIKIRFRCKNLQNLKDWTNAIRTAMTASNHGFITYEAREDSIYANSLNFGDVGGYSAATSPRRTSSMDNGEEYELSESKADNNNRDSKRSSKNMFGSLFTRGASSSEVVGTVGQGPPGIPPGRQLQKARSMLLDENDSLTSLGGGSGGGGVGGVAGGSGSNNHSLSNNYAERSSSGGTVLKMFGITELKALLKENNKLKGDLQKERRKAFQSRQLYEQVNQDLKMTQDQLDSHQRISDRSQDNLNAQLKEMESQKAILMKKISELRLTGSKKDTKINDLNRKLLTWNENDNEILRNIKVMDEWNKKVYQNSLSYIAKLHSNYSNKQLWDACQQGNVLLTEKINTVYNDHKSQHMIPLAKEMMKAYSVLLKTHIKQTISYASLQQAHDSIWSELKEMQDRFYDEFEAPDDDAEAMVLATATVAPF